MSKDKLLKYFETFLKKDSLFKNKKALQITYFPESILHRQEQIDQLAGILAPVLRLEKPSNLFCYGKTGTGKTLTIKHITDQMLKVTQKKKLPVKVFYLNCKLKRVADTEYRLIAQLTRDMGKEVPSTGLPTDEIYKYFLEEVDKERQIILLVLDEIDQLVQKVGDEILYNLTRLNSELKNAELTIIGISNNLMFADNLDPRVKSSLSEEETVFLPYNAIQLQDILRQRATLAFKEGVLAEGLVEKCAAYAAREHGDARRALELLRVAGEIAERKGEIKINIKDLDKAEEKIERDRILDIIKTQPKQFQLTLFSIISTSPNNNSLIFTGEIYDLYKNYCSKVGVRPLTQRRVSDIIAEMDMLGIINARVISKGRYGRTREITLAIPKQNISNIHNALKEGLGL